MSYEKFDSIIESNNRYFSQESILQELTNAVKIRKVEVRRKRQKKRKGREKKMMNNFIKKANLLY